MNFSIEKMTEYEKLCLKSLKETCDKYEMDDYYSIGVPSECRVCILKRKNTWEVFIVEKGIEFDKSSFEDCKDACIEVIHQCSYTQEEFNDACTDYKNMLQNNKDKTLIKK